jgi:hypothetical protein
MCVYSRLEILYQFSGLFRAGLSSGLGLMARAVSKTPYNFLPF